MEAEKTQLQYLSTSMNKFPICSCTEDNDLYSQLLVTDSGLLSSRHDNRKLQDKRTNRLAYNTIPILKLHNATSKTIKSTFDEYSREFEYEPLTMCKAYPCTESSSLDDCVIVSFSQTSTLTCERDYDHPNYVCECISKCLCDGQNHHGNIMDKSFDKCARSHTLSHPHTVTTRVDKSLLKSRVTEGRLQDKRTDRLASQETTTLKAPPTATKATPTTFKVIPTKATPTTFKVIPTTFKAPPTAIKAPPTSDAGVPVDDCSIQHEYDLPVTCKAHPCTESSTIDSQDLAGLSLSQKFILPHEGGTEDPPPFVCGCGLCQSKHIFTDDMLLLTALWPTAWEENEQDWRD